MSSPSVPGTFRPDSQRLVTADANGTLEVWDATAGRPAITLKGHTGRILCAALTPDGKRLASGGEDQRLKVWDATRDPEARRPQR